jgi:hypothetical protein
MGSKPPTTSQAFTSFSATFSAAFSAASAVCSAASAVFRQLRQLFLVSTGVGFYMFLQVSTAEEVGRW